MTSTARHPADRCMPCERAPRVPLRTRDHNRPLRALPAGSSHGTPCHHRRDMANESAAINPAEPAGDVHVSLCASGTIQCV